MTMICRYGFSASSVNTYQAFGYVCNGDESALTSCTLTGSVCAADRADHAIAIECDGTVTEPGSGRYD
jgi:hypothetical protein